jgi:hypothetical protein
MIKLFFIQKIMCLICVLNYLNTYRHKQNCSRLFNTTFNNTSELGSNTKYSNIIKHPLFLFIYTFLITATTQIYQPWTILFMSGLYADHGKMRILCQLSRRYIVLTHAKERYPPERSMRAVSKSFSNKQNIKSQM